MECSAHQFSLGFGKWQLLDHQGHVYYASYCGRMTMCDNGAPLWWRLRVGTQSADHVTCVLFSPIFKRDEFDGISWYIIIKDVLPVPLITVRRTQTFWVVRVSGRLLFQSHCNFSSASHLSWLISKNHHGRKMTWVPNCKELQQHHKSFISVIWFIIVVL